MALEFPAAGVNDGVVRIRQHTDADLEATVAASLDPEVLRWTRVPDQNSVELMREWIDGWQREAQELHLVVVDASSDEILGAIGTVGMDTDQRRCGLGYWLARDARGRGVMARAVTLLSRWLFDEREIDRIEIHVEPANTASRAVAERVGFRLEGILRSYQDLKGRRTDVASYSLLRGELG